MDIAADVNAPSGIAGLDDILRGGFPESCLYLVSGPPGTGKTSLAMQFLIEGARRGERCLYVTLSETRKEIEKVARSHGWDLSGIDTTELIPSENNLSSDAQLTVFNPSEMELGETTEALIGAVNQAQSAAPGDRLALRAAPHRPEPVALSTPGARAEAVLSAATHAPC